MEKGELNRTPEIVYIGNRTTSAEALDNAYEDGTTEGVVQCDSVKRKRRRKMKKHKHRKLLKKTRIQRRRMGKI